MPHSKRLPARERILRCALHEFSQYGYFGARVARITRAARVNPRMLFYYFKNKKGLFNAVQESIWTQSGLSGAPPTEPVDAMDVWYRFYCENPDWARILLWEGMERRKMEPNEAAARGNIWKSNLEKIAERQGSGAWPQALSLPHLLLSLLAIELAPTAFPHQARMLTGLDPFSPEFIRERQVFLRDFIRAITGKTSRMQKQSAKKSAKPGKKLSALAL